MNFLLVASNDDALKLSKDVRKEIIYRKHAAHFAWQQRPKEDFTILFGGDGFILGQSALCDTPLIRVNFGRRGFLANVEPEDIYKKLDLLFLGKYIIQHRDRIIVWYESGDNAITIGNGLNDIVVERTEPRSITFHVTCVGETRDYMGDGVIFSTRTGSSGYNRSAGGPITEKNGFIIINPICPVDQVQWWMVPRVPRITISPELAAARVVVDGKQVYTLEPGKKAHVKLSGISKFVEFGDE